MPVEKFPKHVLIIPDGDGRWARKLNKLPTFGHKKGYIVLQKIIRKLQDLPINTLTVWGFSADNWKRSDGEVSGLMKILEAGIKEALPELIEKNVRFICLGRRDRIPKSLKKTIENAEERTKNNGPKIFCTAIDFSGLDQEIRMMEKVLKLPKNTEVGIDLIKNLRDGYNLITPADLIIRTSGEQRTSDLGWLSQNSEFYSIKKLLPETSPNDFVLALLDYTKRERRFGGRIK
ncbi:MAG: di-trans,poly-cis-decaprenylcistransferase [Candidatus Levybacteria bacterium RIFCSPLOWO2_01_FULL_39_10]|nr:MAG: di-trans,poly-cis-decaprenylcistransferase [Candidatus Levybacteria bacterium RIFCSPLOWO2_01_FULL_39_10]